MLGIRHYKNIAFDLWQGEISDFFCDKLLVLTNKSNYPLENLKKSTSSLEVIVSKSTLENHSFELSQLDNILIKCKEDKTRHLSLFIETKDISQKSLICLNHFKEKIDSALWPSELKRISFLTYNAITFISN